MVLIFKMLQTCVLRGIHNAAIFVKVNTANKRNVGYLTLPWGLEIYKRNKLVAAAGIWDSDRNQMSL